LIQVASDLSSAPGTVDYVSSVAARPASTSPSHAGDPTGSRIALAQAAREFLNNSALIGATPLRSDGTDSPVTETVATQILTHNDMTPVHDAATDLLTQVDTTLAACTGRRMSDYHDFFRSQPAWEWHTAKGTHVSLHYGRGWTLDSSWHSYFEGTVLARMRVRSADGTSTKGFDIAVNPYVSSLGYSRSKFWEMASARLNSSLPHAAITVRARLWGGPAMKGVGPVTALDYATQTLLGKGIRDQQRTPELNALFTQGEHGLGVLGAAGTLRAWFQKAREVSDSPGVVRGVLGLTLANLQHTFVMAALADRSVEEMRVIAEVASHWRASPCELLHTIDRL
jgi:hypothetical protein